MSVITCEKSTSKIGEKLLIFFTFFIEFFLKILIKGKEHNLLPGSVVLQCSIFKCFCTSINCDFGLLLGRFLWPKKIQTGAGKHLLYFYWSIKKWSKCGQITDLLAHFVVFFVYALLHPMNYTPRFC